MARPARVHYLRSNKGERSPHRVLVIDAEADTEPGELRELQTLRLWAARRIIRHNRGGTEPAGHDFDGHTADELVELVEQSASSRETLWVYTHNLSYDLVLTRLPLLMLDRGWELGRHNLASEAPWALLKRRSQSVRLADSWSWLPVAVKTLGERLGLNKLELPTADDPAEAWAARCQSDLNITATAIESLMDEWDRLQLGWWSITGPATGWNSYLHMGPEPTKRHREGAREQGPDGEQGKRNKGPVIDPDAEARLFERRAIYSGRRDVWRRGKPPPGPYVDLDFQSAHLAVCAHMLLPARRSVAFPHLALEDWHLQALETSVIAEAVVRTETPRYPLRYRNAVLHPTGTFQTVLAGPELVEANRRGELVSVGAGYSYRLSAHMKPWARWVWSILYPGQTDPDPMLQVFLKGASRTVPGRWAMQTSRTLRKGPSVLAGWGLEPLMVGSPPKRGALIHLGGEWVEEVKDQEADDSFPAVLAFIQSWVRVLLQRAIDRLGEAAVYQCNTDSMLIREARLLELAAERAERERDIPTTLAALDSGLGELGLATAPLQPRIKAIAHRVTIRSPQHVRLDEQRKYAGVPSAAVEIEPERFRFWTWPKLAGQMERGDPRGYIRELRTINLANLTVNRWAFQDGCCEPVEAAWCPETATTTLQPGEPVCRFHGAPRAPRQHPILARLT